jgi:hypothetical protein
MAAIILNNSQDGVDAEILCDESGNNLVFDSVDEADAWRWDNPSEIGATSRILDLDD